MINRVLLMILMGGLLGAVSACRNTAEGIGEDMEEAGEDIQREVD
jgi:predicted small secreted protein